MYPVRNFVGATFEGLASYTQLLHIFLGIHGDFSNLMQYIFYSIDLILTFKYLTNKFQVLILCNDKCKMNSSKYVEIRDTFCIQLSVYILWEFCMQIVYIVLTMYTFCRSELMYTKCIQNLSHILTNFLYILYTKLSCHSFFWFYLQMWDNEGNVDPLVLLCC